jgi:hypothetical protein
MLSHPVVYSEGYQSPEIAIYNCEDPGVVDPATITNKTDIFTLAIIFHRLWTKNFPDVIGDSCAVGAAVYLNEKIKIDKKFDFEIGPKNGCKFSTLLMWMLQKDATKRPTADKVIDALMDNFDISDEFESAESAAKIDVTPHDLHVKAVVICDKEVLKSMNVKAFYKITDGRQYKYYVKLKDGTEERLTLDEIIAKGYGKATATLSDFNGQAVTEGKLRTGWILTYFDGKTTTSYSLVLFGDVNGDSAVNAVDLLMVRKHLLGTYTLQEEYLRAGDVNRDGTVNAVDLLMVRKHLLGTYEIVQ